MRPSASRSATTCAFYYFVYGFFVAATVTLWRIVNSPFGQVIRAIKQSETRARALGYDTARFKWGVFTLTCAFAGLAGGLYGLARFGAFPEPMSLQQSGNVVLMCLIGGGFASFYGPVLGVVVFLVLRDVLSTLTDHWMLFYGVLFMAVILFMPEGILGLVRRTAPAEDLPRHPRRRPRPPWSSHDRRPARPGGARPPQGVRRPRGARRRHACGFAPRRLTALIGPNGAGKTTCFNLLTGLLAPDAGEIHFQGQEITRLAPDRRARLGICRSFQVLTLFDDATVLENVRVAVPAMRARGFDCWTPAPSVAEATDRAAEVIRLIGLAGREHVAARYLSYGQRRLLEIGVALAGEPTLLLLDEPTSGLGSRPMETLRELVQRLAASLTIVVIEHDMDFVLTLSHHVAVLHRGHRHRPGAAGRDPRRPGGARGVPRAARLRPEVR